jgi:hypothetical protein
MLTLSFVKRHTAMVMWLSNAYRRRYVGMYSVLLLSLLTVSSLLVIKQYAATVQQHFDTSLTDVDQHSLDITLNTLIQVLDRINVTYFMTAGTLLGSYRHHARIPWDDDVDILVRSTDKPIVWKALTALYPHYGLFLGGHIDRPYHWKFYPRRVHGNGVLFKPFRWPFVDLLFYVENETHVWNESPWFTDERWPRQAVFPLTRRPFGDLWLPAPCDTAAVLAVNFNTEICVSRSRSHIYDIPLLPGTSRSVPCSTLADRYPFVQRKTVANNANQVTEQLVLGNKTLRTIVIQVGASKPNYVGGQSSGH